MELSEKALALISAALRHIRDAEHLAHVPPPDQSLDQAYHLAGYAPECARKATLSIRWLDKTLGHRFDPKAEDVIGFVLELDAHAHRYQPTNWGTRYPALALWREDSRYERTGTFEEDEVSPLLKEARKAVDLVILGLWADGRIPAEVLE